MVTAKQKQNKTKNTHYNFKWGMKTEKGKSWKNKDTYHGNVFRIKKEGMGERKRYQNYSGVNLKWYHWNLTGYLGFKQNKWDHTEANRTPSKVI